MTINTKIISIALLLFSVNSLAAIASNQQGTNANDGIQESNLKLGLAWYRENPPKYETHLLQGTFEFMLKDRIGVRGSAGVPLSKVITNMEYYPFSLGAAFHLFPRFWFDIYLGAESGFVYLKSSTLSQNWSPKITAFTGITLYYWGIFFVEGEVGYSVIQYAKDIPLDLSAPTYRIRMGFYF
ncbi:MAG: hypothetical protein LDLANPLL_01023 [Turneriella sp.]|nr:hypothetical protein [Turneriella sp.]